jgi:hypothetical protein
MADNTRQEFEYLDIPDGNGGEERWWCNDSEARAMIKPTASVAEVAAALAELT